MLNSMLNEPTRPVPSTNSAADRRSSAASGAAAAPADDFYLPDFGATSAVVALVFISALVSIVLSLASTTPGPGFFIHLANTSLLMLWMILTSAAVLTMARPVLAQRNVVTATCFALGLVIANIALLSEAVYWLGQNFPRVGSSLDNWLFPAERWEFLSRNLAIGALVSAAALRYFYVMHQWRTNMQREAQSRITALQARIRPHFLFNSMNTIAALTRVDPVAAEQAVEDLADLFRASLSNPGESISLEQELEITRVYQRMEEQRLGERLAVDWQLDGVPMQTRVPGLTIQPLLENAIYHGIEPLADGGTVTVASETSADMVTITVSNPLAPAAERRTGRGHQIALDNIRQRLELAYGTRARLEVEQADDQFSVLVGFPVAA